MPLTPEPRLSRPPAGFWIRAVAAILDSLIVSVVQTPFVYAARMFFTGGNLPVPGAPVPANAPDLMIPTMYTVALVISYIYYAVFYARKGATPGKMIVGLKVVDDHTGAYLTYGQTFLREIVGKFLSTITFMIGYLMVAFRRDKRALHDLLAGTRVIHSE